MANTAIASNRAVPGKYMALEYKYATRFILLFFMPSLLTGMRKENQQSLTLFFIALLSLYFFFFILEQLCFVMTALATRAL